jgi:eukaryotic-like serine/threonine-protein kinase
MADFGGRYRRGRLLGAGGMGEVWLAYDEDLDDRPVAIKVMRPALVAEPEDAARFQREMRLAARMQHPNIMTVYTTGTDDGVPFMVVEYLEGSDLSKVVAGAPGRPAAVMAPEQVARIGRDTCAALAYAHGLGVVHRDIKPGNLFLCDSGLVKVTDFGIAKAVSGTRLSATGTLIGTFPYMAPEQWLGEPAAFSNDVWAVGCVLYELLSGVLPRSYATPTEYVAAAARGERVAPLAGSAGVPSWLAAAIMAMLQPDPRGRPAAADCEALLAGPVAAFPGAARPVRGDASSASAASHTGAWPGAGASATEDSALPPRSRSRRRIAAAAAAIAVLAAAGGAAAALAQGPGKAAASGPGADPGLAATSLASHPASSDVPLATTASASAHSAPAPTAAGITSAPASSASTTGPADGTWIAQLGSVPVSAGSSALQPELAQVRAQVPGAQYLTSDDYASLRPGYWVIYYDGSFANGTEAVAYCAAHGRTTSNQCVGRFLSSNPADITYICPPPGGPGEASCYRP